MLASDHFTCANGHVHCSFSYIQTQRLYSILSLIRSILQGQSQHEAVIYNSSGFSMKRSNPPVFDQDSSKEIHSQISRWSHHHDTADCTAAPNGSKYINIAWLVLFALCFGDKLCQLLGGGCNAGAFTRDLNDTASGTVSLD